MSSLSSVLSAVDSANSYVYGTFYVVSPDSLPFVDSDISLMSELGINTIVLRFEDLSDDRCDSVAEMFEAAGICVTHVVDMDGTADLPAAVKFVNPASVDEATAWEVAWHSDLLRGVTHGRWVQICAPLPSLFYADCRVPRPGERALWALSAAARGADGCVPFHWDYPTPHADLVPLSMRAHASAGSRFFNETKTIADYCSRLTPLRGNVNEHQIAIVIDAVSEAIVAERDPLSFPPFAEARQWHRALWENNFGVDIVTPHDSLDKYSLIIVANLHVDYPQLTQELTQTTQRGAQVIIAGQVPSVDIDGRPLNEGYGGSLTSLMGVRLTDAHPLVESEVSGDARADLVNSLSRSMSLPSESWVGIRSVSMPLSRVLDRIATPTPDLRGSQWVGEATLYQPDSLPRIEAAYPDFWTTLDTDVEAIALFDGSGCGDDLVGKAAITRRPILVDPDIPGARSGAAWYVATSLDALSRSALLQVVTAYARVQPCCTGLPDGVEAIRRGQATFYLNHSDRAVELTGIIGVDLLTGNDCHGHVLLAPRSAIVVASQA